MPDPLEQVEAEVPDRLAELLGQRLEVQAQPGPARADLLLRDESGRTYLVGCRGNAAAASVALSLENLRVALAEEGRGDAIPIVAVPYMGETGRELCARAEVGWLDLSGNAHLVAPGLRVHVEGRPNRFKRPGRPRNPFAPKAARVTRHLLNHPARAWTQQQIAEETGLTPTYVSRTVRKLEDDRLLERDPETNALRPRDPDLLLDAWAERYRFDHHEIRKGHVSSPSNQALLEHLAKTFEGEGMTFALTALPAAWLRDEFAGYRVSTVYLGGTPGEDLLEELGFRETARGSNLWLVEPDDEGVFQGVEEVRGVPCTSPVQTYLDLLHHAERAKDAAAHLRERHLNWSAR